MLHTLVWQWSSFDALSPSQLYALLAARSAVFVVEQSCPYQDMDGFDAHAMHLIAWSGSNVAAYLRVLAPGVKFAEPSIGRVLTTAPYRGTGLGRELMWRGVQYLDEHYPRENARIGAQAHLQAFYGAFGFSAVSDEYMEDGIPHVEMVRRMVDG